MNIVMLLEMAADAFPDRVGIVANGRSYTYAALLGHARAAGEFLRRQGAAHAVYLDVSGAAAPIALFGAAYAGIPYVPLNYRLTKQELDALLLRVAPGTLIASTEYSAPLDMPNDLQPVTAEDFLQTCAGESARVTDAPSDPGAIAVELFTSGTTGKPKAAILRHENFLSYILGSVEFGSADENDASIVCVPPYHIAGISAILSSTYAARRIAFLSNFDPESWIALARAERVSNAFLVPTMLARIVDHVASNEGTLDLPHLRSIAYGGGKMPLATIEKALALLPNVDFTNAYGLTETSSTISVLGPQDHREALHGDTFAARMRLSSVGRPLPSVEIEIRDDDGTVLAAEQAGLVYVRGGQVCGEYHEVGSLLDGDGWFSTRDRGYLDKDGYLFLDGRADDVIVRGGENISPGEVEHVLLSHAAVADAAVVAMPDEEWGEAVGAAVVLKSGMEVSEMALRDWVRCRLRSSRVPKAILFRDELPYNELGKLLRRVVRLEFQEGASENPAQNPDRVVSRD